MICKRTELPLDPPKFPTVQWEGSQGSEYKTLGTFVRGKFYRNGETERKREI